MGRITLFSQDHCRHCERTKAALEAYDIPFVEINLTKHRSRVPALFELSDRGTVPVVFFNEQLVGGELEILDWLDQIAEQGSDRTPFDLYKAEIASQPDPTDPRLEPPIELIEDDETLLESLTSLEPQSSIAQLEYIQSNKNDGDDNDNNTNNTNNNLQQPPGRDESSREVRSPPQSNRNLRQEDLSYRGTTQPSSHRGPSQPSSYRGQTHASSRLSPQKEEEFCVRMPNGRKQSILQVTQLLQKIFPRQDLKYNLKTYRNCFKASDGVKALMEHFGLEVDQAEAFGRDELQLKHKLLDHVVSEHEFCNKDSLYFRLQCYQTPNILNSYRQWKDEVDDSEYLLLLQRLDILWNQIQVAATNTDGKVDYGQLTQQEQYAQFEHDVCALQGVHWGRMTYPTKLAFCINLHNLMIPYAFAKIGIPPTDSARASFFSSVQFQVGQDLLSFPDLVNGILRANRKAPYALNFPFGPKDPRQRLCMPKIEPRIHFALSCGTNSCPYMYFYTAQNIEQELQLAAKVFCEKHVKVDKEQGTVTLSTIFNWYREDFCASNNELPKALEKYMKTSQKKQLAQFLASHPNPQIEFLPYDWSSNAVNYTPYTGGESLRPNVLRFLSIK